MSWLLLALLAACEEEKIDTGTAPLPPWETDEDADGSTLDVDCDDADPSVHPGATELCDGFDQDCDDLIDDNADDAGIWHPDEDGDGYGDTWEQVASCEPIPGYLETGEDCDDSDPAINPDGAESCNGQDDDCDGEADEGELPDAPTWYPDADGDGFGDPDAGAPLCVDTLEGWVLDGTDCDDTNATVYPGADEHCDEVDEDCDGEADDSPIDGRTWYTDADGDAYGDPATEGTACARPSGATPDGTDCDDTDDSVNPAADEHCDGIDEDCDGDIDEDAIDPAEWTLDADGDGWGDGTPTASCEAPSGYVSDEGDCDDADPDVFPGADEHCDGTDEDCDGDTDEDAVDAPAWYADGDSDGYGDPAALQYTCSAPARWVSDATDCDDTDADVFPGADERCDGVDDDCDGTADEDAVDAPVWYADADGDTYGDPAVEAPACTTPAGFVGDATDCDDTDSAVSPANDELCGGADEDCDGTVDEDDAVDAPTWYTDADADTYGDPATSQTACLQPAGQVSDATDCDDADALIHPGRPETCNNGTDDDCDGDDDGCLLTGTQDVADMYQAVVLPRAADTIGTSVSFAGDVDADGDEELLIGVPGENEVWLLSGVPYGDLDVSDASAWLVGGGVDIGARVAGVGDLDGDGYADNAAGALGDDLVYVVNGPWSGEKTLVEADLVVEGDDRLGDTLLGADVDGDGRDDLMVAATRADGAASASGVVYVFYGGASGTLATSDADLVLRGSTAHGWFGGSIAAGDLDGDGREDLVVGAELETTGGLATGAASVFVDPHTSTTADAVFYGVSAYDEAGTSVAIGDTDGDGAAEIVVGAPYAAGTSSSGAVYRVEGPWSGTASLGDSTVVFGAAAGDRAGETVAVADVDDDGLADTIIGSPWADSPAKYAGAVSLLYSSEPWGTDLSTAGLVLIGTLNAQLGASLDVGDIDADGHADLLLGAPYDSTVTTDGGAAWLVVGQGL